MNAIAIGVIVVHFLAGWFPFQLRNDIDKNKEQITILQQQIEFKTISTPDVPQGEKIEQEPQGETGEKFNHGDQGETGPQGDQGIQGVPGKNLKFTIPMEVFLL